MRKDELVHLHSLLALVRTEYERRGDAVPGAFAAYDDMDVSPMAVYGSKTDHERAVRALARGLVESTGEADGRSAQIPTG